MEVFFRFLEANPYILLFLVVGMAVGMGRLTFKGYGLGMVASAIIAGAGGCHNRLHIWSQTGARQLRQVAVLLALYIFIAGFIVCTVPPIIVWAIGYHLFKINPAVLMGGVAGGRSHSGPAREASAEIGSSVPWIGFPVGHAVSGVLLTVYGYVAMVLS